MKQYKTLLSTTLTISIIMLTIYIIHRFIPSMVWAGILSVSTYPLYKQFKHYIGGNDNCAAFFFTLLLSLLFILPFSWLLTTFIQEGQVFVSYMQHINREGGEAPAFLQNLPLVGTTLTSLWDQHIGHPGLLMQAFSHLNVSVVKQIGVNFVHRSIQIGFTILTLFFFYRDGEILLANIDEIGRACLDERWSRYFDRLPNTLRATVNGTIVVGLGVGVCMGCCYALLGFPTPTLTGFLTACAAMIPFLVPLVFLIVALIFLMAGKVLAALTVVIFGTCVMFIADHFIKPVLIGGAIQLPFLAVLFGILGGLETLGLLGLFVGPIILVLFITLCQELKHLSSQ